MADEERDQVRLQFSGWAFGYDVPNHTTGEQERIFLNGVTALELYDLTERAGVEQAYQLFRFAAQIAARPWTDQQEHGLRQCFDAVLADIERRIKELPDPEETALWYSYELLSRQKTTRTRVARLASHLLGRPITAEAWRKAVNKWASEKGMPPLGLPPGRPQKNRNIR